MKNDRPRLEHGEIGWAGQVNKLHETRESLEQEQRTLNRKYMELLAESQRKPPSPEIEAGLSRLRDEINGVDKALKAIK